MVTIELFAKPQNQLPKTHQKCFGALFFLKHGGFANASILFKIIESEKIR